MMQQPRDGARAPVAVARVICCESNVSDTKAKIIFDEVFKVCVV